MSESLLEQNISDESLPQYIEAELLDPAVLDNNELSLPEPAALAAPTEPEEITRREFLYKSRKWAAGAAAVGIALQYGAMAKTISDCANEIGHAEDELWPRNKPSFTFLDGESYRGQKEIAIYLPGFGDMHAEEEAQTWKNISEPSQNLLSGFVDYSNEGTSIQDIVHAIRSNIDISQVNSITLVCRSIGGLYALPVAAELGIPVKSMLLMSSPSSLSNGDFGNFGKLVAHVPENRGIATIFKLGFNAWQAYRRNGVNLSQNIAEGWQATMKGASPLALENELKTAAAIDIRSRELQPKLRKVFLPHFTKVAYAATNEPRSDNTVLVVSSGREFKQEFDDLGVEFQLIGIPYDGHANVTATAKNMKGWTQSTTSPNRTLASK